MDIMDILTKFVSYSRNYNLSHIPFIYFSLLLKMSQR